MDYKINDDDISALKKQINVSTEDATQLLNKFNGDIVEVVLNYYENQDNKDYADKLNVKQDLDEQINKFNICNARLV